MKLSGQQQAAGSIKLSKKNNKILESPKKFEDQLAFDQLKEFAHLLKIKCLYHKDNSITNFCKAPDCLMPLCPECVKIHTEDHTKVGTYGIYVTIDEVWTSVIQEIENIEDCYSKTKSRLQGLQHSNENAKAILLGRMNESKKKTIKLIDDFYRGIESEINEENSIYSKDDLIGMEFTNSKILERLNEIEKFRRKLRGGKFLKYLIIFISSGVFAEHSHYNQEIENYINQMNEKLAFLRDDLQPSFIFNFLNQYITLENKRVNLPKLPIEPIFQQQPPPSYFKEKIPQTPLYNYYSQEQQIPAMSQMPMPQMPMPQMPMPRQYDDQNQSPTRFAPMMIDPNKIITPINPMGLQLNPMNYENPQPGPFMNKQIPPNMMGQSVISPQKPRIFTNQQPPMMSLSEYNSPYPINASIHNSATKASGSKEHLNIRSPFKPLGNIEGLNQYNQPDDMYYVRPSMNQWERI